MVVFRRALFDGGGLGALRPRKARQARLARNTRFENSDFSNSYSLFLESHAFGGFLGRSFQW